MRTWWLSLMVVLVAYLALGLIPAFSAVITNTVSDVNDDAYGVSGSGDNWTDDYALCGYYSGYSKPYLIGAFRFTGLPMTNKATILHAYLRVQVYANGTGSSSFSIVGEDYDSTDSFNIGEYIGRRFPTSASAIWSVSTAWVQDGFYTSPDISGIVQEIVNRSGWVSGNAIAIQLRNRVVSGGYQSIYTMEGAVAYGGSPAQLIIEYAGSASPPDGIKSENYLPGAKDTVSSVPTYLNNPTMYYNSPGGICWATCNADILGYWDRTAYNGVKYWNLIDNGTAPLLQPSLPAAPGHNEADVKSMVVMLATQYYGAGRTDEDVIIEEIANGTNGLAFNATYHGPVGTTTSKSNYYQLVKGEVDAGRPIGLGSWGNYFGGPHQVPVIGYREMSNAVNSTVYIHRNTGGTESEYVNFFSSLWGNLDMDQIVPGGNPVDHYEAKGDNTSATLVSLNPNDVYDFRQTHNFGTVGDVDWIKLTVVTGRQYVVETKNLGASADTLLSLYASNGTTLVAQDDNGGGGLASKIIWRCWTEGTYFLRVTNMINSAGHAANYDVQVTNSVIVNVAPTNILLSSTVVGENMPSNTMVGALSAQDVDMGFPFTFSLVSGTGSVDNTSFVISGSNLLSASSFDYEVKTNYSIRVRVADQGGLSTQKVFAIAITNQNESPTNIVMFGGSVAENLPAGALVGVLSAQDPDIGSVCLYSLVAGAGSDGNPLFVINGSNLLTGVLFNHESQSNFSLRVGCIDEGGLSTQKVFEVNIVDMDETPQFLGQEALAGTSMVLRWSSVTNHFYTIHVSTNLMEGFSVLRSNISAMPLINVYTDSVQGVPVKFWKITTEP